MKVGFNMLVCSSLITREHLPEMKIVKKAGADGVEIPVMEGDVSHYKLLGGILDDLGLKADQGQCFVRPNAVEAGR